MNESILEGFRRRLPLKAQIVYGWLKYKLKPRPDWDEKEFVSYYRWLNETQWWSRDKHEEYQLEKLRALVKHAYENVPYYRRVFDKLKVRPEDIVTLDDLQKLPLLTKKDVIENLEDLVARNIDRASLVYKTTSGSTGTPLGLYRDKHTAHIHDYALLILQCSWAGYKLGDRMLTMLGSVLAAPGTKGTRGWWDYYPGHNELLLSSYDMTEENLFKYIEKIKEFRPNFIYAYPSSIEILARFMKRNNTSIATVQSIHCTAETLYPQQRILIESQFGCRTFGKYAMTERAVEAVECEHHQGYHVNMENGILELLNRYDEPIKSPSTPGRVVGTGFDTWGMPLIRYVTDDVAEFAVSACTCGRQSTLISDFRGRLRELVISKSGYIAPIQPFYGHGQLFSKIRELKFLQEREGELVAQIALAPAFSEVEVAKEFLEEFYEKYSKDEFNVKISFVDRVPRTGRGKLGLLEQRLPIKIEYLDCFVTEMGSNGKEIR
jgi:phenylacetate-CoA ligase